jgi:hypothetical protein
MNRILVVLGALTVFLAAQPVRAQMGYVQPQVGPAGSGQTWVPYLNMLRPGNAAVNYFGLVRPEQQAMQAIGQLQQQVNTPRPNQLSQVAPPRNQGIADTGFAPSGFMQYRQYFFTMGRMQQQQQPGQQVNFNTMPGRIGGGGR